MIEAIKLLDGDLRKICDSIWVTNAPEEIQVERLMRKRGLNRQQALEPDGGGREEEGHHDQDVCEGRDVPTEERVEREIGREGRSDADDAGEHDVDPGRHSPPRVGTPKQLP